MRLFGRQDPKIGTIDVRIKFLWLPLTIGDETRWMEKATIVYEYRYVDDHYGDYAIKVKDWVPIRFVN